MEIFPDHLVTEFRLLASIAPTSLFFLFFDYDFRSYFFTNYLCPSSTEISTSRGSKTPTFLNQLLTFLPNSKFLGTLEQLRLSNRIARIARISTLEPMLEWNPPVELAVFILHLHVIYFFEKIL